MKSLLALIMVGFTVLISSAAIAAPKSPAHLQQAIRYKPVIGAPGFNSLYHLRQAQALIEMGESDKLKYLIAQNYMYFLNAGLPVYNVKALKEDKSIVSFTFEPNGDTVWGFARDLVRY
jgi:hypothetical protein